MGPNFLQNLEALQDQIDALRIQLETHNHGDSTSQRINLFDLFGFFQTISDTIGSTTNLTRKLAQPPIDFYQQFFHWTDTSIKRFYWYDSMNTGSATSGWNYVGVGASGEFVGTWSGTTPTLDLSTARIFNGTLSGNTTFAVSNVPIGRVFIVEVKQGAGTAYTNTWFSGITWVTAGATAPVQTAVSNGYTTYAFRCTAAGAYLGFLVGTN